jgi:hypothetical protein
MNILDHFSESLETVFTGLKILKFFDADPGSGIFLTRNPVWKNSEPGFGINIPDPQHCKTLARTCLGETIRTLRKNVSF